MKKYSTYQYTINISHRNNIGVNMLNYRVYFMSFNMWQAISFLLLNYSTKSESTATYFYQVNISECLCVSKSFVWRFQLIKVASIL